MLYAGDRREGVAVAREPKDVLLYPPPEIFENVPTELFKIFFLRG